MGTTPSDGGWGGERGVSVTDDPSMVGYGPWDTDPGGRGMGMFVRPISGSWTAPNSLKF